MLFRVSLYEIKSRLRRNKCAETVILLHSLRSSPEKWTPQTALVHESV